MRYLAARQAAALSLIAVVVLSLIPVVFVVAASQHGPDVSPDSVGYAAAARSFNVTGHFLYWDGSPFVLWPPGLPLVLALLLRTGVDLATAAIILNCLAAAATVSLTYILASSYVRSPLAALVPALLVATAVATLQVDQALWSEPLFSALVMGCLCLLARINRTGVRPVEFLLLVVLVSVACATRFIGVVLIPVAAGTVGLAILSNGRLRAVALALLTAALSSVGFLAAVIRNLSLGTDAFGPRSASVYSLHAAIVDTATTVGRYVDPFASPQTAVIIGLLVAILASIGVVAFFREGDINRAHALLLPSYIGLYGVLLVVSELSTNITAVNTRYLSPILAPLAVLVVAGGSAIWRGLSDRSLPGLVRLNATRLLRGGLAVAALAFLLLNLNDNLGYIRLAARSGVGYDQVDIVGSPLAASVRSLPPNAELISNDPLAVYWVSERIPVIGAAALRTRSGLLKTELAGGGSAYFVAFTQPLTGQGVTAEDLRAAGFQLGNPAAFSDGTLYTVSLGGQ